MGFYTVEGRLALLFWCGTIYHLKFYIYSCKFWTLFDNTCQFCILLYVCCFIRVCNTTCFLFQYMTDCLTGLPQPDRIKQFGAVRREYEGRRRDVPYRPGLDLDLDMLAADTHRQTREEKRLQGSEEKGEPPEKPRVAFQSPILEYSTALGHLRNTADTSLGTGTENGVRMGIGGVNPFSEDFQKGLSGSLGEIVNPRYALYHMLVCLFFLHYCW